MLVYNTEKTAGAYGEKPLFLGTNPGLFDTINKVYPELWKFYKEMKALDWSEDEFDYTQCNMDFKTCDPSVAEKMKKTLVYQWEQDSVACRAIGPVIASFVTNSEAWAMYQRISDNECLMPEHEVFSRVRGWTPIGRVSVGEEIVQYNPATMETEFAVVSNTVTKAYDDDIVVFENANNTFRQKVTKNHRMLIRRMYGPNRGHEFHDAKVCPAHGGTAFITGGRLAGSNKSLNPKEKLWIAFQADGSYSGDGYTGDRTGTIPLKFSFKKERKKSRFKEIVAATGYELREYDIGDSKPGYSMYNVMVPVSEFIDSGKTFGWVDSSQIGGSWCAEFIDELKHWDSCARDSGRCILTYVTTSAECVEVVQTVAALAGFRVKLKEQVVVGNRKKCYQLNITDIQYVTGNTVNATRIRYRGDVHCVTVPSGAFLTRVDGVVSVTGNCIHAATYSEIVRMSFDDPAKVLTEILEIKESIARMEAVARVFDDALLASHQYPLGLVPNDQELFNRVYLFIVALFIMERVQFMASFAVTFTICASGLFQPIGQAIKKICQDEYEVHVQAGKAVLNILHATEQGRIAREQTRATVETLFGEVIESEFKFVDFLFEDDKPLVGTNAEFLKKWVLFCGKDVVNFLGIDHTYGKLPKDNPMPHLEKWIDMNKLQAAPMEQDHGMYKVGVVIDDSDNGDFSDFL